MLCCDRNPWGGLTFRRWWVRCHVCLNLSWRHLITRFRRSQTLSVSPGEMSVRYVSLVMSVWLTDLCVCLCSRDTERESNRSTDDRNPSDECECVPPPPANSFQLEADLRKISAYPQSTYRYLKVQSQRLTVMSPHTSVFQFGWKHSLVYFSKSVQTFIQRSSRTLWSLTFSLKSSRRFTAFTFSESKINVTLWTQTLMNRPMIIVFQTWRRFCSAGRTETPDTCQEIRHGRHVHVIWWQERYIHTNTHTRTDRECSDVCWCVWKCVSVVQELFDWIHRSGLEDDSVKDLKKKYGLWPLTSAHMMTEVWFLCTWGRLHMLKNITWHELHSRTKPNVLSEITNDWMWLDDH